MFGWMEDGLVFFDVIGGCLGGLFFPDWFWPGAPGFSPFVGRSPLVLVPSLYGWGWNLNEKAHYAHAPGLAVQECHKNPLGFFR